MSATEPSFWPSKQYTSMPVWMSAAFLTMPSLLHYSSTLMAPDIQRSRYRATLLLRGLDLPLVSIAGHACRSRLRTGTGQAVTNQSWWHRACRADGSELQLSSLTVQADCAPRLSTGGSSWL